MTNYNSQGYIVHWCGCERLTMFDNRACWYHQMKTKLRNSIVHYWRYLRSADYRQQCRDNKEITAILGCEIQSEIDKEVIADLLKEMKAAVDATD